MATNENKATKPAETINDNRVEVFIPKGYANDDPNFLVSVNCVNYVLPRGKKSMVLPHIAYEVERSKRAEAARDEKMEQMLEASK